MNKIMKCVVGAIAIAVSAITVGCKSLPSESTVSTVSYSMGVVAGYTVELSKTKTEVRNAIVEVLDVASAVTPAAGETFVAAWTPVIEKEVAKLVEAGKVTETEASLIKTAATVACNGIDFIFTRHPTWKDYQNLVSSAVDGFVAGFKSVVAVDTGKLSATSKKYADNDVEAYRAYLKANAK